MRELFLSWYRGSWVGDRNQSWGQGNAFPKGVSNLCKAQRHTGMVCLLQLQAGLPRYEWGGADITEDFVEWTESLYSASLYMESSMQARTMLLKIPHQWNPILWHIILYTKRINKYLLNMIPETMGSHWKILNMRAIWSMGEQWPGRGREQLAGSEGLETMVKTIISGLPLPDLLLFLLVIRSYDA